MNHDQMLMMQVGQLTHYNTMLHNQLQQQTAQLQQQANQINSIDGLWQQRLDAAEYREGQLQEQLQEKQLQEQSWAHEESMLEARRLTETLAHLEAKLADARTESVGLERILRARNEEINQLQLVLTSVERDSRESARVQSNKVLQLSTTITLLKEAAAATAEQKERPNPTQNGKQQEDEDEFAARLAGCEKSFAHKLGIAEKTIARTKAQLQTVREELALEKKKSTPSPTNKSKAKDKAVSQPHPEHKQASDEKTQLSQSSLSSQISPLSLASLNMMQVRSELIDANQHATMSAQQWERQRRTLEDMLMLLRREGITMPIPTMEGDEDLVLSSHAATSTSLPHLRAMVGLLERLMRDDRIFSSSLSHTLSTHVLNMHRNFIARSSLSPSDTKSFQATIKSIEVLRDSSKVQCQNMHKHLGIVEEQAKQFIADLECVD